MDRELYAKGIRFACQGSGHCCRFREGYGFVYVEIEERRRLATHLGLDLSSFTRRYCDRTDGLVHLKHPDRDCLFLRDDRCSVYEARPLQCRSWPFWPENMTRDAWQNEVVAICPGVGKGRLYSAAEIESIMTGGFPGECPGPVASPPRVATDKKPRPPSRSQG